MAYSQAREFMFCSLCGTMLSLVSPKYAECPLCKFKPSAKGILGREIGYTITVEDIRRDLGISHVSEEMKTKESAAMINKTCEKCGHDKLEYMTRQMRSADEGQTVFYTCPKCKNQTKED
ncbi:hypothetical protein DITRI_Ditri10aG0012500 [Diplodiscus trichospermus]